MSTYPRQRAAATISAVFAVALLINVFGLGPAFHEHGEMHDAGHCVICLFHATGSIAPPLTAEPPSLLASGLQLPPPHVERPADDHPLTILVRGPPTSPA